MIEPQNEAELALAIGQAAVEKTRLRIVGGGTRQALGNPVDADEKLSLAGLNGVTLYEPGALTLVVQAGTPLAQIDALLAEEGQHLPFEPMDQRTLLGTDGAPTIGSVVATNTSGPRRIQAGSCRDSLIGIRFVNGDGEIVKNGGRVMKNVTGYDLTRLMAGAYGSLGVISEVAFKVLPRPETRATLRCEGLVDEQAILALSRALGSPFEITGAAHETQGPSGEAVTMIRLEGFEGSVSYRTEQLKTLLADLGDWQVENSNEQTAKTWAEVRDVEAFKGLNGNVWRVSVRPTQGPKIVAQLRAAGHCDNVIYDWGGGLVWILSPCNSDLRSKVNLNGGHITLVRGSVEDRKTYGVFHPEAARLSQISQQLRKKFDPHGIINPGIMGD